MSDTQHATGETPHQAHAEMEGDRMRLGLLIGSITAVCLTIVVLVAFAKQYFQQSVYAEIERKAAASDELVHLRADSYAKLHSWQWEDKKAGVLRVPVGRAMQLVIDDYAKPLPPAPAGTANAAPANAPAPTGNAAPAKAENAAPAHARQASPAHAPRGEKALASGRVKEAAK